MSEYIEPLTADEFLSLVYQSKADAVDSITKGFRKGHTYSGDVIILWLGSIANEYRKEALKLDRT